MNLNWSTMKKRISKHKKRPWTAEEDELLRQVYAITSQGKLEEMFGRSMNAISQRARMACITRPRFSRVWPPEKDEILRELYPRMRNEDIAKILGTTSSAIMGRAFTLRLFKDADWARERSSKGYFPKGHVPANKGKKWQEYMSEDSRKKAQRTQFKKGHTPNNHKPVGYERKTRDGYIEVKVAEPNVFKGKNRIVWEQHYGPIPEGMHVSFKDGNKENFDIDNLMLEGLADKFNRCCSIHTRYPDEVRKLIQLKGALKRQINKINKEK